MSRLIARAIILALLVGACVAPPAATPTPTPTPVAISASPPPTASRSLPATPTTTAEASVCLGRDPHEHVYHPARLVLIAPCVTATGVVAHLKLEPDGDSHIQLALDPGQERLLNDANRTGQKGNLVLEIVCVGPVTQADAVSACAGWTQTLRNPPAGAHISVTGPHVLDTAHGWQEIHPVFEWHVLR